MDVTEPLWASEPFHIILVIQFFKSFPKSRGTKCRLMRALKREEERFQQNREEGWQRKGRQASDKPATSSVIMRGEGDSLGHEELTWTPFQAGRQTMSHIHKYLLASTKQGVWGQDSCPQFLWLLGSASLHHCSLPETHPGGGGLGLQVSRYC